jgi:hypothetical protein
MSIKFDSTANCLNERRISKSPPTNNHRVGAMRVTRNNTSQKALPVRAKYDFEPKPVVDRILYLTRIWW